MLSLTLLLVVAAFVLTLLHGLWSPARAPLWVAVLLLTLVHLLPFLPVR